MTAGAKRYAPLDEGKRYKFRTRQTRQWFVGEMVTTTDSVEGKHAIFRFGNGETCSVKFDRCTETNEPLSHQPPGEPDPVENTLVRDGRRLHHPPAGSFPFPGALVPSNATAQATPAGPGGGHPLAHHHNVIGGNALGRGVPPPLPGQHPRILHAQHATAAPAVPVYALRLAPPPTRGLPHTGATIPGQGVPHHGMSASHQGAQYYGVPAGAGPLAGGFYAGGPPAPIGQGGAYYAGAQAPGSAYYGAIPARSQGGAYYAGANVAPGQLAPSHGAFGQGVAPRGVPGGTAPPLDIDDYYDYYEYYANSDYESDTDNAAAPGYAPADNAAAPGYAPAYDTPGAGSSSTRGSSSRGNGGHGTQGSSGASGSSSSTRKR